jgi:glycerol-3-phosphate O-acyltransferase/dihydroxyacetone phosphate acyltransferase
MIYKIIRFLFRITTRFYFKKLQVKGAENIPKTGPVFFVANHPSAFMDPLVIATITDRPLFFLAKGALFQNKFTKWLLPKFNAIPIFRSHETPGQSSKNKDIFIQCYKHFAKGGCLLAFPEGISLTERKIKKIQSGTARICLGAEAEYNYSLDIKIVTIGLNFSDPHKFQSELFVNIDEPINVSGYYEANKKDSFKAAHALTDEIKKRLEKQVVAIQDSEVDKFVGNIETIYKAQLIKDLGHSPKEMEHDFNTTKAISESVHYFIEKDAERVERLKNKINSYLQNLEHIQLNDVLIRSVGRKAPVFDAIMSFLFLVTGFPLFLFGAVNNYLPFKIPGWLTSRITKQREYYGPIALSAGTFLFLIFYSLQIWLAVKYFDDKMVTVAYAISLPLSGMFAYYYYKRFLTIKGNWKIFSLFYKRNKLISSLISVREEIIVELEKARKEYVAYRDNRIVEIGKEQGDDTNNFFSLSI